MASSVTDTNPQQGGKKGKDKNNDMMDLVEERLAEINTTMSALIGMVDDMDRRMEARVRWGHGRASWGDTMVMTSVVANFKKELQAL